MGIGGGSRSSTAATLSTGLVQGYTYAAGWRKRTAHLRMPDDLADITREFFRFGAEQDALYDAITCDPEWDVVQRSLQDDASGERGEQVPEGWDAARWHVFYAYQSAAVLAMYRAWIESGRAIPVEEAAEYAASLVCGGAGSLKRDLAQTSAISLHSPIRRTS